MLVMADVMIAFGVVRDAIVEPDGICTEKGATR